MNSMDVVSKRIARCIFGALLGAQVEQEEERLVTPEEVADYIKNEVSRQGWELIVGVARGLLSQAEADGLVVFLELPDDKKV